MHLLIDPQMAQDPDICQIAHETGRSTREVAWLLLEVWGWAIAQGEDGFLPWVQIHQIPWVIQGTDADFWRAVARAGLIEERDEGLRFPWLPDQRRQRVPPRPLFVA